MCIVCADLFQEPFSYVFKRGSMLGSFRTIKMKTTFDIVENDASTEEESAKESEAGNLKDEARQKLLRLRRYKSVSRAEDIVKEDEKQRRAQPDKPYVVRSEVLLNTNAYLLTKYPKKYICNAYQSKNYCIL